LAINRGSVISITAFPSPCSHKSSDPLSKYH
jgi:hypothetical protein